MSFAGAPGWLWIAFTMFAVVMQSVRTAGQKQLSSTLDPLTVTMVRFLYGLPFAAIYLWAVWSPAPDAGLPGLTFWIFTVAGGLAQIVATVLLVKLFALRNFAVGTTFARTEAFLTAMLGTLLFGEALGGLAWLGVMVSVAGVVALSVTRTSGSLTLDRTTFFSRAGAYGLATGGLFALSSLSIRTASHSLGMPDPLSSAALTLVAMLLVQTTICVGWTAARDAGAFRAMLRHGRLCVVVGLTSALGSVGWFTALTLERAAYVKALGQAEFVLSLMISTLVFKERSSAAELSGIALVAAGIVVLLLA